MNRHVIITALLAGTALLGLNACGDAAEVAGNAASGAPEVAPTADVVTVLEEPTLIGEVPAPTGEVLLTIRGGETHNVGRTLQLDRTILGLLGTVSLTVADEQAMGGEHEFTGPLMRDVLALAGGDSATVMHALAVNDYAVDVPTSDAHDLPLVLATEMDGSPMSVEDYGPLRFVYPDEALGLDPAVYDARWIWQLVALDLE